MELLVVDGYNVAHAWPQTKALLQAGRQLEEVRRQLVARLAAHAATTALRIVVVFDAPPRRGTANPAAAAAEVVDGVEIRFGGGAFGSADHLIERLVYDAMRPPAAERVRVATGDRMVRDMVRAMGADTVDPAVLDTEIGQTAGDTQGRISRLSREAGFSQRVENRLPAEVRNHLEALRRGEPPLQPGGPATGPEPPAKGT
jgi:predicted RNA-binding protein with PIN domain